MPEAEARDKFLTIFGPGPDNFGSGFGHARFMKSAILLVTCVFGAALSQAAQPAGYVAHEWGTFTSVQGADGAQMDWNPLVTTELPKFVYDRSRPRAGIFPLAGKSGTVARQRLETPVIYFYSAKEQQVAASVTFPEGTVTEWYPQQNPVPRSILKPNEPAARWLNLSILAPSAKAPALLKEAAGSHYYAARATDSNLVQIATPDGKVETEKFLFYRGIGSFMAPLTVKQATPLGAELTLRNSGGEPLAGMVVYEVRGKEARFSWVPTLAAGEERAFSFPGSSAFEPLSTARVRLAADLRRVLTAAGLYEAEAAAMVQTWDDAWLAETGLRVLYVIPRAWTDRTLPLTLDPKPRELARVMVGRAEVIPAAVEQRLQTLVERYLQENEQARNVTVEEIRGLALGRFAEPAMRRVCGRQSQNKEFLNAAWEVLYKAYAPSPQPPVVAKG